ncbi:MAG: hypothetical protein JO266_09780 [Acidobacteria bacterium]|nr:hypothetical protein [Acidobacteriota bacterium]
MATQQARSFMRMKTPRATRRALDLGNQISTVQPRRTRGLSGNTRLDARGGEFGATPGRRFIGWLTGWRPKRAPRKTDIENARRLAGMIRVQPGDAT